jgi:hypothetical protein
MIKMVNNQLEFSHIYAEDKLFVLHKATVQKTNNIL